MPQFEKHLPNNTKSKEQDPNNPPAYSAGWFDYDLAFSRNIGWFTEWEQQQLRDKRVAIAGMGGVGGIHMLTFARLGVGRFHVADFDKFELANFNRQAGATVRTLGQPKAASVVAMTYDINPQADIRVFDQGLTEDNLPSFLEGVDVYIDGLDFFVLDIRRKLFALAREKGIPAITAAPIGIGTGYLVFTPDSMSFEDFFQLEGRSCNQQYVNFLLGLTPAMLHRAYLVDASRVDMLDKRGPSTAIACQLCAGVAASEAVKLMLGRGPVKAAPYFHHFDAYRGKFVVRKLRWGNAGPLQHIKTWLAGRLVHRLSTAARPREEELELHTPTLLRILDLARWTPSPDNSQPWDFKIVNDTQVRILLNLEQENPYSYRKSEPLWLSFGMLLENLRLAATTVGWAMTWQLDETAGRFEIAVHFEPDEKISADPLAHFIKIRSVDRGTYRFGRALTPADKKTLHEALGPDLSIQWIDGLTDRIKLGLVNASATRLRLLSKQCYAIHQKVIDWTTRYSRTGLPSRALGLDPLAQKIMRLVMQRWSWMNLAARSLGAAHYAGLEMDVLPAIGSSGFAIIYQAAPTPKGITPEDRLAIGSRLMRFWLEATRRGLALQPSLAAIFAASQAQHQTLESELVDQTPSVSKAYQKVTGLDPNTIIFQARLGVPKSLAMSARSIRKTLSQVVTH